jgi:tellurium resistance protein TerD
MSKVINLNKAPSKSINLSKHDDGLENIRIRLWWNAPPATPKFDLDLSVFTLANTPNGPKMFDTDYFVFYGNESSPDGSIVKSPDARDDVGEELLDIRIPLLPQEADEESLIVTIHKGDTRKQTFGHNAKGEKVEAGVEIINLDSGEVIATYDLDEAYTDETAVQIGSFFKADGEFTFQGIGQGYKLKLDDFVAGYATDDVEIVHS